jgi:hypothetical protein
MRFAEEVLRRALHSTASVTTIAVAYSVGLTARGEIDDRRRQLVVEEDVAGQVAVNQLGRLVRRRRPAVDDVGERSSEARPVLLDRCEELRLPADLVLGAIERLQYERPGEPGATGAAGERLRHADGAKGGEYASRRRHLNRHDSARLDETRPVPGTVTRVAGLRDPSAQNPCTHT